MHTSAAAHAAIGNKVFDFYRCRRCTRLLTQPELTAALVANGSGCACPCGGLSYNPTNPTFFERFSWRVITFAVARAWELGVRGIVGNVKSNWSGEPVMPDDPTPPPGVGAPNR